ncbi:uncharacterized protein LOC120332606 isoform X1 [Styela clava]
MANNKMKNGVGMLYASLIILLAWINSSDAQANYCNVNGVTHQVGETWTTATGNDRLKKCTCTRRGQWNCFYAREDALMVVADVTNIAKVKLSNAAGFTTSFIRDLPGRTVAVDVDIESDTIYWTDVSYKGRGIYKATFSNGHNPRRIITEDVYEPNGIAVDWLAKNVYWTDAQMRSIYVAKENGQHKTLVVGGLSEPRGIVVLPLHGIMFWSDQEDGTIETAAMDGSNRKVVIGGLGWPNEIAVDVTRTKIYWIDGKKRTIESCNFDGTSWKKILDFAITFDSPGYGLSLFGGRLYFSIWREKAVYSVTVLGQDLKQVVSGLNENLAGIAIINRDMQQAPISNSMGLCRRHRSPCSHICLPKSRGSYSCACPEKTGMVLSQDQHTCKVPEEFILFTSVHDGSIMIASKEFGTKPNPVLLTHATQPSGIDYDPIDKMMYWSDVATNAIYRMRLNGTGYDVFLEDGIGIVDGIVVDWVNRHLYFTNYGWEAQDKQFGRIEFIRLDGTGRKVLVQQGLDRPRDIVIDQERGFLYYSDWGVDAKVVRLDLDGRNPHLVPVVVENPNGLALDDAILFVTDSHRKSALVEVNGTIIYGRPPSLIKYDTALDKLEENMDLEFEVPFGLSMDQKTLFVTDWGTGAVSEIDVNTGIMKPIAKGIGKPTGIVRASLNPKKKYKNDCMKGKKCSHVCVPVDQDYSSCLCPDNIGKAMSENDFDCVAPDRFVLIADVNKILMISDSPDDPSTYMVVRTFDDYSNIVAIAFDPITHYVYWADNGRQRICRKMLGSPLAGDGGTTKDIEVIYTEIEMVEGMALDPDNRLLYWTDGGLGTIEMMDLSGMTHATVHEQLNNPRAITLDSSMGVIYWTEWGRAAMLMSSRMNGYDPRPLITTDLKWPNGLYYDVDEDKIYVADGAKLKLQSISAISRSYNNFGVDILDFIDLNGTVEHLFGLGKMGAHLLFTDWETGTLYKRGLLESSVLVTNLTRPTQIYTHFSAYRPEIKSQCSTAIHDCSHICVPSAGSYRCLCPDHLVLANNLKNCVRPENLHLYTTTLEPPVTIDEDLTTMAWGDEFTEAMEFEEERTLRLERLPEVTTVANTTAIMTTTIYMETATTPEPTTATQATTTTLPPLPRFPLCMELLSNETALFTISIPEDEGFIEINANLLSLRALNIADKDLNVTLVNTQYSKVYPGVHNIQFKATDRYNRSIYCNTTVTVKDVTPPKILYCPSDLDVEAYDDGKTTFVTWMEPKFEDNTGVTPIVVNTHKPGQFMDGIHTVEYTAYDTAGNSIVCSFMVAVMHRSARCGSPWVPPNSYLTCHSDMVTGDQVCQITCQDGYSLSLKTPIIKCRHDLDKYSIDWLPFLDDNVCKLPAIGNPQQVITLQYPCPCRPTSTFYEYTYQIMARRLRDAVSCMTRQYSLGLCINAEKKMFLECVNASTVELVIKVDLAKLDEVSTISEARRIVKRSVTEILDKAVGGEFQARGSDMKDYSASEEAKLSDMNVLCKKGFKGVKDGCVQCPRGTYWHEGDCEFCPLHTFQEKTGTPQCIECADGTGTRNIGSTHRSHCVKMVRQEEIGQPSVILIVSLAVGGVVLIAVIFSILAACWFKRKRRKQIEKEAAEAARKKRRARRRRSSASSNQASIGVVPVQGAPPEQGQEIRTISRELDNEFESGDMSNSRTTSRRSGTSSGKRVTIKEETIEHSIPHREETIPHKADPKPIEPSWRMALVMRNTAGMKKNINKMKKPPKSVSSVTTDDTRSETSANDSATEGTTEAEEERSQMSATQSEAETDKTLTDGQTTDGETTIRTDTETSVGASESDASTIRKSRRLMSSTSDLGDETMSMTSGNSSRATTPIKGVLKKPKRLVSMDDSVAFTADSTFSNTLENARMSGDTRGRNNLRRSQRQSGRRSVSPQQAGNKQPLGMRRSVSVDRGPIGVGAHKMFDRDRDPRFHTMGHRPGAPMPPRPGGPMPGQQPIFPPGVRPRFMGGPRLMTRPPPGAVIYQHPNHPNMRMAFVPMNPGARPRMQPGRMPMPPPYGYDSTSEWDSMSQGGSDIDMRKPPRHRMPPPGMMPGYPRPVYGRMRMPVGEMMPPPQYGAGYAGPRQPRYPPGPGY